MLPPFIIEQIRKREEARTPQPVVQLPLHDAPMRPLPKREDDVVDRGVVIIDLA